jgi:hypothetical protein
VDDGVRKRSGAVSRVNIRPICGRSGGERKRRPDPRRCNHQFGHNSFTTLGRDKRGYFIRGRDGQVLVYIDYCPWCGYELCDVIP